MKQSGNNFRIVWRNDHGGSAVGSAILIGSLVLMMFGGITLYGESMAKMFDHLRSTYTEAVSN